MNDDTLPLYPGPNIQKMETRNESGPAGTSTVYVNNSGNIVQTPLLLGPENTVTSCPFCQTSVKTTIKHTTTTRTHMTATLCFFICCCCCIPYCCASAKNTDHYCPSCLKYLGTYEK